MAVTAFASGTQTCTVTTEHTLSDVNEAGVFTFVADFVNAAAGDVFEIRIYQMVLTGGTRRVLLFDAVYGAQPTHDQIRATVPVSNELTDSGALRFSIKQTFGTGRNVPWKVLKHA